MQPVSDVPMGNPARPRRCQDLIGDANILLQPHPSPIFGELRMTALNCEGRVVVLAIGGEEFGEHGVVPPFPRGLVGLHESGNGHDSPA